MSKVYFKEISYIKEILASVEHSQLFVLADENSKKHCYPLIKDHLEYHHIIEVISGGKT